MIQYADEKHPVVVAFYKGREFGPLSSRLVAWNQRSIYSHSEILLGRRPNTLFYECASSTLRDGGVRIVVQPLDPQQWDCWMLPHISPDFVRAWFDLHDSDTYDLSGLLGFFWRRVKGSKSASWCSEACAEALGVGDAWRYDVATLVSLVRVMGEPIPLQQSFI